MLITKITCTKKTFASIFILTVLLTACHKYQANPPETAKPSIIGEWNVDTLTTYFYDSTGLILKNDHVYPAGAPDYPYHFRFKKDYSLIESIHLPGDANYTFANGTYSPTSDSTFTLMYVTSVSGRDIEPCKIVSISNYSFVFSKEFATLLNGTEPGFVKYVYKLTKL